MRIARTGMVLLAAAGAVMVALGAATYAWGGAPGASASPLGVVPLASMNSAGAVSGTVRVTNVRDQGFAVSWLTTAEVTGAVRYGQSPSSMTAIAQDEITTTGRTHHVTLGGDDLSSLSPDTLYYYDILSGGVLDDNGGVHYLYATGATLSIVSPMDNVFGLVLTATGAGLPGSVVYWWLQDVGAGGSPGWSQPESVPAVEGGGWYFNTGGVRQGDLTDYFEYISSTDRIMLNVQGAPDGRASDSFPVSLGAGRTVTVAVGMLAPPPAPSPVASPTPAPDLVVDDVVASPGGPGPGCPLTLTVSISNQGSVSVTTPFRVALYLDHSRVPYPGERSNTNTYWVVSQTLAPGDTFSLSAMNPAAASGAITTLTASGSHTLYAQVDSYNNQVGETDEGNNVWGPLLVDTSGTCYHIYLPLITKAM